MERIVRKLIIVFIVGIIFELSLTAVIAVAENPPTLFTPAPTPLPTATPSPTPTPTPAFGRPVRFEIPAFNLSVPVEEVAIDELGNMGVAQNFGNVGWYALGTRPGWQGNAVITGHYDTYTGSPAVFYNLRYLPIGSDLILNDELGRKLTYRVERSESRPVGNWSLDELFGPSDETRLNLITCSGWWNPSLHNYSHRHIVFSRLVE